MNKLIISRPSYKECNINNVVIDSQIIIKNKCFHQDELNDDFSVSMSKRDDFLIGGVIKLRNTYTFGNNDKGVEMFEFIPINWRYPRFLVPTNIKKNLIKNKDKVLDQFVVVRYKEWKSKLPIGYIDKHLGNVENLVAQYEILFYYYPTMPIVKPKMMEGGLADYKEPTQITIEDGCGDEIYSVDPEGCIDIDDAISYDFKNKRIGIHIADVAEILKEYKHDRYSTVYAPHKNIHMIPDEIATEMASLREGKIKNVITCWIDDAEGSDYSFETNNIIIKKNLTYDQAEKLKETNESLKILYEKSIELGKKIGIEVIDTHKMVEVFMVLYNKNITEYLEGQNGMIFRNQKGFGKAVYEFNRSGHSSLGLTHYTHATSPIRRYVDWMIQRIFKKQMIIGDINLERVNEYEREIKRLSRMWDYLKASREMKSGDVYEIEFREIQDNRLIFFCHKLNIIIANKIAFDIIENGMKINGNEYKIGEKYNRELYLVDDKKNILFYKILIQF